MLGMVGCRWTASHEEAEVVPLDFLNNARQLHLEGRTHNVVVEPQLLQRWMFFSTKHFDEILSSSIANFVEAQVQLLQPQTLRQVASDVAGALITQTVGAQGDLSQ